MQLRFAAALAALTLAAAPAQALIASITLSGGTAFANGGVGQIIAAPATTNIATGNNLVGFNEKQSSSLVNDIGLGNLSPQAFLFATNTVGNVVSIGVSSYFFLFNTLNLSATGTITFSQYQRIIGIQRNAFFINSPRSNQLETGATDFSGFTNADALDDLDIFTFVGPRTLLFSMYTHNADGFRVITRVPEPTSWVMLIAGFGMVGAAARRRKAVVAA